MLECHWSLSFSPPPLHIHLILHWSWSVFVCRFYSQHCQWHAMTLPFWGNHLSVLVMVVCRIIHHQSSAASLFDRLNLHCPHHCCWWVHGEFHGDVGETQLTKDGQSFHLRHRSCLAHPVNASLQLLSHPLLLPVSSGLALGGMGMINNQRERLQQMHQWWGGRVRFRRSWIGTESWVGRPPVTRGTGRQVTQIQTNIF